MGGIQILIRVIRPFNAFLILKLTCVYIKAEVIKNNIKGTTAATNEVCIEWLHENCYLWWEKWVIFWLLDEIPTPFSGFPTKVWGKMEESTPGGGNKATLKERQFLVRSSIQECNFGR